MKNHNKPAMETKTRIKEEVISEIPTENEQRSFFTEAAEEVNNDCKVEVKQERFADSSALKQESLFAEDTLAQVKKLSNSEKDVKVEVKEEVLWLEGISQETPSAYNEVKGCVDEEVPVLDSTRNFGTKVDTPEPEEVVKLKSNIIETPSVSLKKVETSSSLEDSNKPNSDLQNLDKKSLECNICKRSYSRMSGLKRHYLLHQGKLHQCDQCDKTFADLSYLKKHKSRHDGDKCDLCDEKFVWASDLRRHKLIHQYEVQYKCEVCGEPFSSMSNLVKHNFIHQEEKTYKCELCEKSFNRLSNWKRHVVLHWGTKPHKCEICEKVFRDMSSLRRHNTTHKGNNQYKCKLCGDAFTELSLLKRHKHIHEGKAPNTCVICERSFNRLSSLRRHNRTHINRQTQEGGD